MVLQQAWDKREALMNDKRVQNDKISRDEVPQIFRQKKTKKIGIRCQDLEESFEKFIKGSILALSSPRLVIPAVIYGLWGLSQHFMKYIFDFQVLLNATYSVMSMCPDFLISLKCM